MPVEKQKTYESGTFIQLAHTTLSSPKLSWGALGLWHYMLSKPLHWKFSFNELVNSSKDGVFKVNSYLKELIKSGYVERIKKRDKNGRFSYDFLAKEIVLSELSGSQKTVAVSSDTDSTAAGNSIPNYIDNKLYIKDLSQEKREKINKREKKEGEKKLDEFPSTSSGNGKEGSPTKLDFRMLGFLRQPNLRVDQIISSAYPLSFTEKLNTE